jgi:hypothetical protein
VRHQNESGEERREGDEKDGVDLVAPSSRPGFLGVLALAGPSPRWRAVPGLS